MKKLVGNLMYGQSGGPTSVINASAYGVISQAREDKDYIKDIYIMKHGIQGALNEEFFIINDKYDQDIELLKHTPGSAFGSVRYKLKSEEEDPSDYLRLLEVFKKHNIRYFLYNGGNDSMDTCSKIAAFMKKQHYDINIIGVPKTIDNDLPFTDHTPGFSSAAKYIANVITEIAYDMTAYPQGKVVIVEIMGRHAGWLTASSALASINGYGPDLIYLPEKAFSLKQFKEDVSAVYKKNKSCLVAVSEGIVNEAGDFVFASKIKDDFGHSQLGGVAAKLSQIINIDLGISTRSVELSSSQRSASHLQSLTDVEEAILVGKHAVRFAIDGCNDVMIGIKRISSQPYQVEYTHFDLKKCANTEKKMPDHMINDQANGVTNAFIEYCLPLIQGENQPKYHLGIQKFAKIY